jgi:YspA, cpYpsA-related SLOG family
MAKKKDNPVSYRILVTGSRDWTDKPTLRHAIFQTWQAAGSPKQTILIVGGARGADTYAQLCGESFGFIIELYEADWEKEKRSAGPQRNQRMVNSGANICLAFLIPPSKGTADCIKKAEKAGIPVEIYYQSDEHLAKLQELDQYKIVFKGL